LTVTPTIFFYEADSGAAIGPVCRVRQFAVSEDSRQYASKAMAIASLPPLGKSFSDYPDANITCDGNPLYRDDPSSHIVWGLQQIAGSTPNPFFNAGGTGEAIYVPHFILNGGSLLDVEHRTIGIEYTSSLVTALGTSDQTVAVDLVPFPKPQGAIKTADTGKALRGALENLPVEAA